MLGADTFRCCVTSPPYWGLRDYGEKCQIGREKTPREYVDALVAVFRQVRRVLTEDGTLWLNIGDSYAGKPSGWQGKNGKRASRTFTAKSDFVKGGDGLKAKDLVGIPWRVAFALQDDGWYLRSEIIWHKLNPMPESVKDRPTRSHEQVFLLSKSPTYHYDADAIREPISASTFERFGDSPGRIRPNGKPTHAKIVGEQSCGVNPAGRNARTVWTLSSEPSTEAHFAVFPSELPKRCILAGSKVGETMSLRPVRWQRDGRQGRGGSGRSATMIELNVDARRSRTSQCADGARVVIPPPRIRQRVVDGGDLVAALPRRARGHDGDEAARQVVVLLPQGERHALDHARPHGLVVRRGCLGGGGLGARALAGPGVEAQGPRAEGWAQSAGLEPSRPTSRRSSGSSRRRGPRSRGPAGSTSTSRPTAACPPRSRGRARPGCSAGRSSTRT